MFPKSCESPLDEESFDGEDFDALPEVIPDFLRCISFRDWVDLMTPIWQAQMEDLRKQGYLGGIHE